MVVFIRVFVSFTLAGSRAPSDCIHLRLGVKIFIRTTLQAVHSIRCILRATALFRPLRDFSSAAMRSASFNSVWYSSNLFFHVICVDNYCSEFYWATLLSLIAPRVQPSINAVGKQTLWIHRFQTTLMRICI